MADHIRDECSDQVRGKWTSNNQYSAQWRELVGLSVGAELVATASHIGRSKKRSRDFPGGAVVKNLPANSETWVQSLGREDPTFHGATKLMRHNY